MGDFPVTVTVTVTAHIRHLREVEKFAPSRRKPYFLKEKKMAAPAPTLSVVAKTAAPAPATQAAPGIKEKIQAVMANPLVKLGVTLGVCYGVYKFAPKGEAHKTLRAALTAGACGVAGVAILRNAPIVKNIAAV